MDSPTQASLYPSIGHTAFFLRGFAELDKSMGITTLLMFLFVAQNLNHP